RHTDTPNLRSARSAAMRSAGYCEWWKDRALAQRSAGVGEAVLARARGATERRSLLALSRRRTVERGIASTIATRGPRPQNRAVECPAGRRPQRREARASDA